MLTTARVHAVLPAVDLKRARTFYEGKLGLKVVNEDPSPGFVLKAGAGTYIYVYERSATKADHTVAGFTVDDVEAIVKELKGRGVVFEDYDTPDLKTVDGIATMGDMKFAWFKDTEGNILAIGNMKLEV